MLWSGIPLKFFDGDAPKIMGVIEAFSLCNNVDVFGPQLSARNKTDIILKGGCIAIFTVYCF